MRALDLKGQRFGRLTVIEQIKNLGTSRAWTCRCDCGQLCIARTNHLKRGMIVSCGCKKSEVARTANLRHGQCRRTGRTRVWNTWVAMKRRCYYPHDDSFSNYGQRGIQVCARWFSFDSFYADMGKAPSGMTIHRINNDGHYMPSNCRWATHKEQQSNRTNNHNIEINGVSRTITDWAESQNISHQVIHWRISNGWSISKAVFTPPRKVRVRLKQKLGKDYEPEQGRI